VAADGGDAESGPHGGVVGEVDPVGDGGERLGGWAGGDDGVSCGRVAGWVLAVEGFGGEVAADARGPCHFGVPGDPGGAVDPAAAGHFEFGCDDFSSDFE